MYSTADADAPIAMSRAMRHTVPATNVPALVATGVLAEFRRSIFPEVFGVTRQTWVPAARSRMYAPVTVNASARTVARRYARASAAPIDVVQFADAAAAVPPVVILM